MMNDEQEQIVNANIAVIEANRKNVLAVKSFCQDTRGMLRDLQTLVANLSNTVNMLSDALSQQQNEIRLLQQRLYSGGPTDGH